MSWLFLLALAEGYLPTFYSDTSPFVRLSGMNIASKSYQHGKKTVTFPGFQSLEMSSNLTENCGAALLTWYRAGFPAKTLAPQEKVQASTANDPACGRTWLESSVRYDRATHSWKTHPCLSDEVLPESSVTLPKWGMTRDGVVSPLPTLERRTRGSVFGSLLPTHGDYLAESENRPQTIVRAA
jgi:hypothetical protein